MKFVIQIEKNIIFILYLNNYSEKTKTVKILLILSI
jgi:hypothetical protein